MSSSHNDNKSRQRYRATLDRHKKRTSYLRKFNSSKSFTPSFLDIRSVWSDDSTVACGRRKEPYVDDGSATTGSASFSSTRIDDDSSAGHSKPLPLLRELSTSVKGLFQMDFSGNDLVASRQGGDSLLRDEDFVWYDGPRDNRATNRNSRSFDTLDISTDGTSPASFSTLDRSAQVVRMSSFTNFSRVISSHQLDERDTK